MAVRFDVTSVADSTPFDNDSNGFVADNVQDAIEEAQTSIKGGLLDFIFVSNGNTANKWLQVGNGSTASDHVPFVTPHDGAIAWLTWSNEDDNVDVDVELYLNGTLALTWEIRNKRTGWKTDFPPVAVVQGDRVSCFTRKVTSGTGDSTSADPVVEVGIQITGSNEAEGGTQNGV